MSAAPSHIRPATRGDLPEVVDLLNACDVAEVGEPDTTADDVESDWGMEGFELARDAWVGLGDAMLTHAFAALAARGRLHVELGVDAEGETQPLRTYERAGMHVTFTYELYAK